MTFLPIVSRELRLAARRRGTYWVRSGAALAVMLLGTWLFLLLQSEPPANVAMALFCILTGAAVLFGLLSGPRSTADCLSEEKREGTLGLLFLTDLKGYDVVLGKLVAGSLDAFYSVVSVLPMMAIPFLMGGGLTLGEFGRMALVAGDALFFSLTLGICVSAMSQSAQKAATMTSLVVLSVVGGLPLCGWLIAVAARHSSVNPLLLAPSVGFSYYLAFDAPYKADKTWFWLSLGVVHGLSWLCLILACVIAPRSWQDRVAGASSVLWRERWRRWRYGDETERAGLRRRLLDANPVYWLAARMRSKPAMVWVFLGLLTAGWVWAWWRLRRSWLNDSVYVTTAVVVNLALRYWFAGEATRALAEHRKAGALELLLSTPLTIEDILRGLRLALSRQFLGPVLAVLAVECVFMLATVREAIPDDDRLLWFAVWTAGMSMLVADLAALYWVGMWQGLTARNPIRAAGGSLARVLVLRWVAYALLLSLYVLVELGHGAYQSNPGWRFFLGLWFGLGIGFDVGFGGWARRKLLTEFRWAAEQRYAPRKDVWRRWFGALKPAVSGVAPAKLDPEVRA